MAKKVKSKFTVYAEYVPFYLLYHFIRGLSLKAAYRISGVLILLLYYLDFKHRRRTVSHLLHAGVAKNRTEAVALSKRVFRHFGKLLVESVKMDQCYDPAKISLRGPQDSIDRAFLPSEKRVYPNTIIATAHYGNWEVAGTAYSDKTRTEQVSIMRAFDNPLIGKMILDHRQSRHHHLVSKEQGIRPVLKALKDRWNFSILIDQHASRTEGVETVFFGHPCRTHMTPALLHLKTGVPIVPELTRRLPGDDFRFEIILGDLIIYQPTGDKEHDVREICQLCTTALEKLIAEDPEQWLWAARRWLDADGRTK